MYIKSSLNKKKACPLKKLLIVQVSIYLELKGYRYYDAVNSMIEYVLCGYIFDMAKPAI